MRVCGVYLLTCERHGKLPVYYVGQTADFARRKKEHLYGLRHGKHGNRRLQNVFDVYGKVDIQLLERCTPNELNDTEQWWIDEMRGHPRVANAAADARSNRGYRKTEEARRAQSLRQRGALNPMFGTKWSEARRAARSESQSGSNNRFFGKTHSDASKELMSANAAGRRTEVRSKIASSLRGRKLPNEVVEKLKVCHPTKGVKGVGAGGVVREFRSLGDAERAGFHKTHIAECCSGRRKTHGGLTWSWTHACLPKEEGAAAPGP